MEQFHIRDNLMQGFIGVSSHDNDFESLLKFSNPSDRFDAIHPGWHPDVNISDSEGLVGRLCGFDNLTGFISTGGMRQFKRR